MSEWISVSEKMPEKDDRYLVVEGGTFRWIGVCSLRNGKWDTTKISHWMPLPSPPKEEIYEEKRI